MRIINGMAYPGTLIKKHHTLKQMRDFLNRSKGANRLYWHARIDEFKNQTKMFKSLFGKRRIKNG